MKPTDLAPAQQNMNYDIPTQREIEESSNKIYEQSVLYVPPPLPSLIWSMDCWGFFRNFKQQIQAATNRNYDNSSQRIKPS